MTACIGIYFFYFNVIKSLAIFKNFLYRLNSTASQLFYFKMKLILVKYQF